MKNWNLVHFLGVILTSFLIINKGVALVCEEESFACANGNKCVPKLWICDGEHDCIDGSDEETCGSVNASCAPTQFKCSTGRCLHKNWRCDKERDCSDGSDELNCDSVQKCQAERFECDNKKCLSPVFVCDGEDDCGDRSDEKNCSATCSPNHFRCAANGRCILKAWRCDGEEDCRDGSDEKSCPTSTEVSCKRGQFRCGNGQCIPTTFVCDGDKDCPDEKDEENCRKTTCSNREFKCSDGKCLLKGWRCDGEKDCFDGSDEENCSRSTCPEGQFLCSRTVTKGLKHLVHCIKNESLCNGIADCLDGSDEINCPVSERNAICQHSNPKNCSETGNCTSSIICDSCVALWRENNGTKKILMHGCWSKCDRQENCIERKIRHPDLRYCCCIGQNCNGIDNKTTSVEACTEFRCKDGVSCIPRSSVCDGISDCLGREDEENCEAECLTSLGIVNVWSPQDSRSIRTLRSHSIFVNNTQSAWCSKKGWPDQWATLDLGKVRTISTIISLGYPVATQPGFANFTIQFSSDNQTYYNYTEAGKNKLFHGNPDPLHKSKNFFEQHVKARFVRLHPVASPGQNYACMRVAVLGCDREVFPGVELSHRRVIADVRTNAVINCTGLFQRNQPLKPEWFMETNSDRPFEKLQTGHNYLVEDVGTVIPANRTVLFARRSIRLTFRYSIDYIRERFTCLVNKTVGQVLCTAKYSCGATYGNKPPSQSFKVAVIQYNLGGAVKSIILSVQNVTASEATVVWELKEKPNYLLSIQSYLILMFNKREKLLRLVRLNEGFSKLNGLQPYRRVRARLVIQPNTFIGVKGMLASNTVQFTTLVKEPGIPPNLTLVQIGATMAIIHCKPPPQTMRNGPIDGFIFSYKRTKFGNQLVTENETKLVLKGEEVIQLSGLAASSVYLLKALAYNILNGKELRSGESKMTITTLEGMPSSKVSNVKANFEPPNKIRISWSPPTSKNSVVEHFDGFQIRVHEIYSGKRVRRQISSITRLISVEKQTTSKSVAVTHDVMLCMISVAVFSKEGTGPFSDPIVVNTKRKTTPGPRSSKHSSVSKRGSDGATTGNPEVRTSDRIKSTRTTTSEVQEATTKGREGAIAANSGKSGKNEKVFFLEFIISVSVAVLLLLLVIILAYKCWVYTKRAHWDHHGCNGHRYNGKTAEPFLLDQDGDDVSQPATPLDSYPYPKNDFRDKISLSSL